MADKVPKAWAWRVWWAAAVVLPQLTLPKSWGGCSLLTPPPPNTNITLPVYTHKTSPLDPTCSCVCFCESVNPPAAPLMPDPVCLHTQS